MSNSQDLLVELGTEELPPKALSGLSDALARLFTTQLKEHRLSFDSVKQFATPRRLALLISGLQTQQEDRQSIRFGPAVKAAYDADGNPTKAAEGFARSCGVEVSALEKAEKDGVEKLCYSQQEVGRDAREIVPEILKQSLAQLPIPKRMRWGSSRDEFVRPVHWLVLLLGSEAISVNLLGVNSGQTSRGHRFLHNEEIKITQPGDYENCLEEPGKVIADFARRREMIRELVRAEAEKAGGEIVLDEDLLNEVTSLVEYPVALMGEFDDGFLDLPAEALILTLKSHQKCFCVVDAQGKLMPRFITVSNLLSKDPARVIEGNERVIRPRLADARFFYESDQQTPLLDRAEALKKLVFQDKLGTVYDKSQRVSELAAWLAEQVSADKAQCQRAAILAKCDLLTQMVGEFADLQGLMGCYYARNDGEPEEVARAIYEQYQPTQSGGELPSTRTGTVLALADKIDTMVGLFGIGQPPTGSKDPFALRRSAIGVLRILIDNELELDIREAVAFSVSTYSAERFQQDPTNQVVDFLFDRFKAWYADEGIATVIFQAVLAVRPTRPLDFHRRVLAVSKFFSLPESEALAAANKRVSNILDKDSGSDLDLVVDESLFSDAAEKSLHEAIIAKKGEVAPSFEKGDYSTGLLSLADLRKSIDEFFDQVLVMAEDDKVKQNRLALLKQLRDLFLQTADISYLSQS